MSKRALVTLCVCGVAVILSICIYLGLGHYTFTQEKWLNEPNNRHQIVNNLLETKSFRGMSHKEIIELLGPSDEKYTNGMYQLTKNNAPIDYYNDMGIFYFIAKGQTLNRPCQRT